MGEDRRRRKFHKEQHDYVDQLRNYRRQGIPIFIDGKIASQERDWYKIFEIRDDGATYMADFVSIEQGIVTEIHFDLVYLDLDARQAWEGQKRLEEDRRRAQMQHYQSILQKGQRLRVWEGDDKNQVHPERDKGEA